MVDLVHIVARDDVAVLTLNRPPGNVLTPDLRSSLSKALDQVVQTGTITGIVLAGAGRGFCPGVDITEYNGPLATPWVSELCQQIEACSKPVVAALHGGVMGAGFELALATHARVAHRDARLAMPDIKLGMIPGGGATQRLPRLLGAQRSLEILLSGQVIRASDPRLGRLITQLTETNPVDSAIVLARALAAKGHWAMTRNTDAGFSDPEGFQSSLTAIRAQLKKPEGATYDILRCVEASQLLPFEQGLAFEKALFEERLTAPKARGARHFLMAEKRAAAAPKTGEIRVVQVRHVVLIGTQERLAGLGLMLLKAGYAVSLVCQDLPRAEHFSAALARGLQAEAKQGRITQEVVQKGLNVLEHKHGVAALTNADLVIDDGSLPIEHMPDLPSHLIWSVLEPARSAKERGVALGLQKPVIGLHPYTPLSSRHVVELSCDAMHAAGDVKALMDVVGALGKSPVLTVMPAGGIRSRLSRSLWAAALELQAAGLHPYEIDRAASEAGFTEGPFVLMDKHGLSRVRALVADLTSGRNSQAILDNLIAAGRTGAGAGQGFYTYPDGRARPDNALNTVLPKSPARRDAPAPEIELVRSALFGVLANDAVRLMRDGAVRRVSDIDLVLVKGFGFDAGLGGPLLQVDLRGVFYLYKDMQRLEALSPIWTPDEGLVDMVKQGEGFFGRSVG